MRRTFLPRLSFLAAVAAALLSWSVSAPAAAKELVVDLSDPVVQITAGFAGTEILLFGAKKGPGDVVVVIRGPARDQLVRRKDRKFGVWVNDAEIEFRHVPTFYWMASNRPIDEFLGEELRDLHQIGLEHVDLRPTTDVPAGLDLDSFRAGLKRSMAAKGLYSREPSFLTFLGDHLFRTNVRFPANVSTGTFSVDVYLIRDGEVVAYETNLLNVRKFGLEAGIYGFAQRHSLAYGVLAILIAGVAGWAANAVFRKA